jgi:hypothetical protein
LKHSEARSIVIEDAPDRVLKSMRFSGTDSYVATEDLTVAVNATSLSKGRFW